MAKVTEQLKKFEYEGSFKTEEEAYECVRKDIQRKRCADFNKLD